MKKQKAMKRLTQRVYPKDSAEMILHHGHRWGPAFFKGEGYQEYIALLDRLAAYEDIGFTPEELTAIVARAEQCAEEAPEEA